MDDKWYEKAIGSGFTAEYEGMGFYSLRKEGWPDYVTMGNGGDALEGTYDSRDYLFRPMVEKAIDERDELIRDLLERRYDVAAFAGDPALRRKAVDFLLRRGFDAETAYGAVRALRAD